MGHLAAAVSDHTVVSFQHSTLEGRIPISTLKEWSGPSQGDLAELLT